MWALRPAHRQNIMKIIVGNEYVFVGYDFYEWKTSLKNGSKKIHTKNTVEKN